MWKTSTLEALDAAKAGGGGTAYGQRWERRSEDRAAARTEEKQGGAVNTSPGDCISI